METGQLFYFQLLNEYLIPLNSFKNFNGNTHTQIQFKIIMRIMRKEAQLGNDGKPH